MSEIVESKDKVNDSLPPPPKKTRIGCDHYERKCALQAPCCSKIYSCRFCHDAVENHPLKRNEVKIVQCISCQTEQKVQNACEKCDTVFAKYFCHLCCLYDDSDQDKKQFHCDGCGICRVGGRENYFHCDKCGICLSLKLKDAHKCVENASQSNCPVCLENLHSSRAGCHVPKCGHLIHEKCWLELTKNYYSVAGPRCPICNMSYSRDGMQKFWESMENDMANTPMPVEYRDCYVLIHCNDCNKECQATFHVIGHKCAACGSFNTHQMTGPKRREGAAPDTSADDSTLDDSTEIANSFSNEFLESSPDDDDDSNEDSFVDTNS